MGSDIREFARSLSLSTIVGLGFFAYNLYTVVDSMASNFLSSPLSGQVPAPYDLYSLGMVAALAIVCLARPVRSVCMTRSALAVSATLMAVGPFYAIINLPEAASYLLAFIGGSGKGVVILHVGRMLSRLPFKNLCQIVLISNAASVIIGSLCSSVPAVFVVVSFIAVPACAGAAALVQARWADEGTKAEKAPAQTLFLRNEVTAASFAMAVLTAGTIFCLFPLDRLLSSSTTMASFQIAALRIPPTIAVCGCLLWLWGRARGIAASWKALVMCSVGGVVVFLCWGDMIAPAAFCLSFAGRVLLLNLFWVTAPVMSLCADDERGISILRFALLALSYCGSLSLALMAFRVLWNLEMAAVALAIGALLVLVGVLFLLPDRAYLFGVLEEPRKVDWGQIIGAVSLEYNLSPREREVLDLIARGRDSRMIQQALSVSSSTVSTHTQSIYRKMGVHSRQEIIDLVDGRFRSNDEPEID